jgi:hypothetical protein
MRPTTNRSLKMRVIIELKNTSEFNNHKQLKGVHRKIQTENTYKQIKESVDKAIENKLKNVYLYTDRFYGINLKDILKKAYKNAYVSKLSYHGYYKVGTINAWSYRWWQYLKVIKGKIVFNDYSYSNQTVKHQINCKNLLKTLGINVDLYIQSVRGLQNMSEVILDLVYQVNEITNAILKPKTRKSTNETRLMRAKSKLDELETLAKLLKVKSSIPKSMYKQLKQAELKIKQQTNSKSSKIIVIKQPEVETQTETKPTESHGLRLINE